MRGIFEGRFMSRFAIAVVIFLVLNLVYWDLHGRSTGAFWGTVVVSETEEQQCQLNEPSHDIPLLSTEPKVSFRENLREDTKYITTWPSNGWTNDVMAYFNLIYLGLLADRVPILARFAPTHVGSAAGFIPFSEIFDIPRLSQSLKTPVLEWDQLKNMTHEPLEDLGCWGTHSTLFNGGVLRTTTEYHLGLDISYTPIPNSAHIDHNMNEYKANIMALAALSYPETRAAAIANPPRPVAPSPEHEHTLPPDEQLECFDFTYDVGIYEAWEWEYEWTPAWKKVGRYARFNPNLVSLAEGMVKRAFGLPESAPLPLMITLHVRRADFAVWCNDVPPEECLAPLSAYIRRVEQLKSQLAERGIGPIDHVLVSSDERDPVFWEQVRELGWSAIDHEKEQTEEKYGKWYPVIIDVTAQSFGKGFVGTDRSTLSLVTLKRVLDWNDGVYYRVRWGRIGADDD